MRTIGGLPIVKESDAKFPFGATIQNETDTQEGTPVVREIYGDIVMNNYKLLELTGISPTENEDSDDTQYQIVEALKKLPNVLNDVEQTVIKTGLVFSVAMDIDFLPNKYMFIGRVTDDFVSTETNTFKGTSATEYPFSSPTGFNATDEVLFVIDTTNVRAYSLTKVTSGPEEISTTMGEVLQYNDSETLYFTDSGALLSDFPTVDDLQAIIRVDQSDGTLYIEDMVVLQGYVACYTFKPSDDNYGKIFCFDLNDLSTPIEFTETGATVLRGEFTPQMYTDGMNLYFTNEAGNSSSDQAFSAYFFNIASQQINFVSTVGLNVAFVKTKNAVVKSSHIYVLDSGQLSKFNISSGSFVSSSNYFNLSGQLFQFNGNVYFGSGQVAKKWTI